MKKETYSKIKGIPSTLISFRYSTIAFCITFIMFYIIPKVLNYGPGSINTSFDIQMSYVSYNIQFILVTTAIILGITLLTKFLLRDIDDWHKNPEKYINTNMINKIRKQCLSFPYAFFAIELLLPFIVAVTVLSFTGSHETIMITKILILLISFALFLSVISFIFAKDLYDKILSETYVEGINTGLKINLKKRIFLIIFPVSLASLLLTSLIAYSSSVYEKEEILFNVYNEKLENSFDKSKKYDINELTNILESINLYNSSDTKFILGPDGKVITLCGTEPSYFVIEYTKQLSDLYGGKIYDSYGVDTQGSSIKVFTSDGEFHIGILYDVSSERTFTYLLIGIIFLILVVIAQLYIFSNSLSKSLSQISNGFESIYNNTTDYTPLPVTSNDEIGQLVSSFNKIQKINFEQVQAIKNNQEMLIEKERLASLGQMIGGIAHNLKTPIFSISGGTEGLNDLIDEFKSSVNDPSVTNDDMLDIANDMSKWIEKIKIHLSYMSDVITAVKGQTVTLSDSNNITFSIKEVLSHINVLMRHELKSSLVSLNISNNVPNTTLINGNINSLVQILNNFITNAIQEYKKEPNKQIDLETNVFDSNVIISIKDYGHGIPDKIKNKLFKEMVTTKGKDGTGLGLFLSYSTIKANFNGDIKFDTSENGTTFYITLPICNT